MKFYSFNTYRTHLRDLRNITDVADEKKLCLNFVGQVANSFSREYWRIGLLSLNDLMQEGYLALLESWDKLDWEVINNLPEDERQPYIWNFIKQGMKWAITDVIMDNRSTVRIPKGYLSSTELDL